MVETAQIITVSLANGDISLALKFAKGNCINGRSTIHKDRVERKAQLMEDEIVGMLGVIAFSKVFFGRVHPFVEARWVASQHPKEGDGGSDFIGSNIDVKNSRMRAGPDPLAYHLWVRQREWHEDVVYVRAMTPEIDILKKRATVYLVGWALGTELPEPNFEDRRELKNNLLHPLPPFQWSWYASS